jgi:hypothetical protein
VTRKKTKPEVMGPCVKIDVVQVEGSEVFRRVDEKHPCWEPEGHHGWKDERLTNAFVRIEAPAAASDEQVDSIRNWVLYCGARAARVAPRRRAAVVVQVARERRARGGIRATVEEMVAEANSVDQQALHAYVENVMGEVGL